MKKLLSIFGAIGLVVTPMSSFSISCSSPKSLPHYNSDGDFNEQVNDAWDTSILKTVSTWTKPQPDPDPDPDSSQLSDEPATINMTLIRNQLRDLIMYRFENWAEIKSGVTATIEKIGFFENEYANSNSINNDEELAARLKVSDKIYFSLDGKTFLDLVVTDKPLAKFAYNVYSTKSEKNYEAILRFDGNKFKGLKETWNSNENGARADITKQFLTSLGNNSIIITKNNGSEEKQLARDYFVHSFQTESPKISSFENELFNWNSDDFDWDTWLGEFINGTNDGDGIYGISFDPTIK
jgi:hypothetical protein